MNVYTRIGMYLFIIGALLTVFASVFPVDGFGPVVNAALIFTGFFAGLLNITSDEEHQFLVSGLVFLVALVALNSFFGEGFPLVLHRFMQNAALFVGTMTMLVAMRNILEMASQNYHATPVERMRHRTKQLEALEHSASRRAWNFVVFLAVALTFILLLVDGFFYEALPPEARTAVLLIDWTVIILFIIDVIVLWRERENARQFFRECWPDLIAAIPLSNSVLGLLKVVRVTRVARLMRVARVARVHQSAKFFSTESGFHTYLHKHEDHVAHGEKMRAQEVLHAHDAELTPAQEIPETAPLPEIPEEASLPPEAEEPLARSKKPRAPRKKSAKKRSSKKTTSTKRPTKKRKKRS